MLQATESINNLEDLGRERLARFLITVIRRAILHYGIWFNEVHHQLGLEEALIIEKDVAGKSVSIITRRVGGIMGDHAGINPFSFAEISRAMLIELIDTHCVNWLALDGVWFQAVENRYDMYTAKRCNDTCWSRFSPLEAQVISSFLNLPLQSGLEGLKKALDFRLYARINRQSAEIKNGSLIFRMNSCRVQDARKRKGLPDYPCKSAGVTEYSTFARNIDSRINTECLACPPDEHPETWACAWRFYITG